MQRRQSVWLFIVISLLIESFSSGEKVKLICLSRRRSNHESFDNIVTPKILDIKNRRSLHKDVDRDRTPLHDKLWPPWPFNLIGRRQKVNDTNENGPATRSRFITYLRQSSRIGIRQIQQRKSITVTTA
jgi:hypothetical protein